MPLSTGARLGPYEVLSAIGAGGMGEVYKARDTRLDRSVAIKVLPPEVSADPDRRARFEREAKTIAGLNHPHICTLYDVGDLDGSTFLVMEHLAGETLAQRLEEGPLPIEHALTIATEIADALTAAHRQGVIHRDLKPGNVMLTKTGAKLLDFGLAKLAGHGDRPAANGLESAPTRTAPLTSEGAIVGTLQYMAPEQVEGRPADARTDLWALGAILYEMLTGKRAFEGASAASLIANIMNAEPPALVTLQPITPPALDRLVRQCLAKSPDDRPDTAHDLANDLRGIREISGVGVQAATPRPLRRGLQVVLVVAGALAMVAVGAGLMWLLRPEPPRALVTRVSLDVRPADELNAGGVVSVLLAAGGSRTALTWTPDGQTLVFVGRRDGIQQIYVRQLDAAEARPLADTEGAQTPAVSLDGQWVAFWANGTIRKVRLAGGPAMDLAEGVGEPPSGLVWDARGRLFFGRQQGTIWEIPAAGAPKPATMKGEADVTHGLPWPLPGGRALVYTVRKRAWSWGDEEIVAQTLATGERKVLLRGATDARYLSTGHLVFLRRGVLSAVPFDPERLQVLGREVPVVELVAQALSGVDSSDVTGAGQFAVSAAGDLAWVPGPVMRSPDSVLVTVDRTGRVTPLPAPVRGYSGTVRVSPDHRRLLVPIRDLDGVGLWVYDLERGTLIPLNRDGEIDKGIWSPDGRRIAFLWLKDGRYLLASQPADGSAPPSVGVKGELFPSCFTPDGRNVVSVRFSDVESNIVSVSMEDGKASVQPLETRNVEAFPQLSPDGRWLVYTSAISGRWEVYVRPYPGPGSAEPASVEGGTAPAWNPNGRELFFISVRDATDTRRMMAVDFSPGSPPRIGRPRPLFELKDRDFPSGGNPVRSYDVAPDGQHFYWVQRRPSPPPPPVTHINLIENWFEELKAKVPVKR